MMQPTLTVAPEFKKATKFTSAIRQLIIEKAQETHDSHVIADAVWDQLDDAQRIALARVLLPEYVNDVLRAKRHNGIARAFARNEKVVGKPRPVVPAEVYEAPYIFFDGTSINLGELEEDDLTRLIAERQKLIRGATTDQVRLENLKRALKTFHVKKVKELSPAVLRDCLRGTFDAHK